MRYTHNIIQVDTYIILMYPLLKLNYKIKQILFTRGFFFSKKKSEDKSFFSNI